MPFTPGHGIKGNPSGTSREHRKALRSLALELRENVDFAEIRRRLVEMAHGKDPATGEKCSVLDQQRAMQMLLDRAFGQAAQHVVVEGEIRNEIIAIEPRAARAPMTIQEINERRTRLRELGVKPKIIDAESVPKQLQAASGEDAE